MSAHFTNGPWFRADDLMDQWRAEKRERILMYTQSNPIVDLTGRMICSVSQRRLLQFDGDEDEEMHANERIIIASTEFFEKVWNLDHILVQQPHVTIHRGGILHEELKSLLTKVEGK